MAKRGFMQTDWICLRYVLPGYPVMENSAAFVYLQRQRGILETSMSNSLQNAIVWGLP